MMCLAICYLGLADIVNFGELDNDLTNYNFASTSTKTICGCTKEFASLPFDVQGFIADLGFFVKLSVIETAIGVLALGSVVFTLSVYSEALLRYICYRKALGGARFAGIRTNEHGVVESTGHA